MKLAEIFLYHTLFRRETSLFQTRKHSFCKKDIIFNTFAKSFFSGGGGGGGEAQVFGRKLPHPKVNRVLALNLEAQT